MAPKDTPSYTDLVYEALKSAERPLTFPEVFEEVNRRRPVTTRNPKATVRNVLSQSPQLVSLGDGRYAYLPNLLAGSLFRLPLAGRRPAREPLIYPGELLQGLWPSFFEAQKRQSGRPAHLRLPNGEEVDLPLQFAGQGVWGSVMPDVLARYLVENRAADGDSLLIRVLDAEAGRCEAWFEARRRRDQAAVAARNREVADAVYQILHRIPASASRRALFIWELVTALFARGLYRADVAPDTLETVLKSDSRFVDAGLMSWTLAESVTPEMQSEIESAKRLESEIRGALSSPVSPTEPSPRAARFGMERMLADLTAAMSGREFGSVEEADAFLHDITSGGLPPRRELATALDRAQETMYDAWEATDPRRRAELARKALAISPDCADAYVLLAEETARSLAEAADLFAKGVAAGERALGKRAFQEGAGRFWGLIETRPYMRARFGLAQTLWVLGRRQEAIEHAWALLRLNPGDNQGVRYVLLPWLLEVGEDAQAKRLLSQYPDDAAASWHYGHALSAFRTEGDTPRSRKLLAEARTTNPFVPAYLLGKRRLPRDIPDMVGFGDESEAVSCAAEQMLAWRQTPGALAWLAAHSD